MTWRQIELEFHVLFGKDVVVVVKNTINRLLLLTRMIGSDMRKIQNILFAIIVFALTGCNETVSYEFEHASKEDSLAPIFSTSCKYRCGTHDVDLGRLDCVFDLQSDSSEIMSELVAKYGEAGWRLVRRERGHLGFRLGSKCVEIEVKEAVYVIVE